MSQTPDVLRFDLHSESATLEKTVKTLRQVILLLTTLSSILVLWFVTIALIHGVHGFQWVVLVVVLFCLSGLVGLFLLVLWKTGLGAVGLAICSEGLQFVWSTGQAELLPWAELAHGFKLQDYSGTEAGRAYPENNWSLRRWNRPVTCLSKDAFNAIIRAASNRGLVATENWTGTGPIRWVDCREVRFSSQDQSGAS